MRNYMEFLLDNFSGRDHLGDLNTRKKIKVSLRLTKHHALKTYGGMEV
jgi:hypothetical protein